MSKIPDRLITYCSNIHPGETWMETFAGLKRHIPLVKAAVSPKHAFPIGLRLSHRAAVELSRTKESGLFKEWLAEHDCFVPTINGFPFGCFHGTQVKERVYLPDWRSSERADYSILLADLLANWLPEAINGSISTVPLGFKGHAKRDDLPLIRAQLERVLYHLVRLRENTGKTIVVALEPEPGCFLETTEEVVDFFEESDFPPALLKHLGICFDCCHQAVEFEEPLASWNRLVETGITIAKVQVSSALQFTGKNPAPLERLIEPCYLHQVVVRRRHGELFRYPDLPRALACHEPGPGDEWRCHFHVPVFLKQSEKLETTRDFLEQLLPTIPRTVLLEVETYTWEVLPPELRCGEVTDSIVREIMWVKQQVGT